MTSSPDAASLQEQGCSELKLQATEVEVSGVKNRPELPPITLRAFELELDRSGLYYEGVVDDLKKTLDSSSEGWHQNSMNSLQANNPPMNSIK